MANLTPASTWDSVLQLETTHQAIAGAGGTMNLQAQALLNRTQVLYDQAFGVGQAWQDVKASRALNTTYTNTTGKTITVFVGCTAPTMSNVGVAANINNGSTYITGTYAANGCYPSVYFQVPSGSTYLVFSDGQSLTLSAWRELR